MIERMTLKNFGPIKNLQWDECGSINLIVGRNGSGKTFLLKALYSAMRTVEEYKRGDNHTFIQDILIEKLYWTFQNEKAGDLVSKGENNPLSLELLLDGNEFGYSFGKDTTKVISTIKNTISPRLSNSIFLPAKEILSLHNVILRSRETDKSFGFDDTYLDLARALRQSPRNGKHASVFAKTRKSLEDLLEGKIRFEESSHRWKYFKGNQKYSIEVTAEGIKKLATLDTLLSNQYLDDNSIIFIDEPEAALHPQAISKFMEILVELVQNTSIQIFMASHSNFVIKKLAILARQNTMAIPFISEEESGWEHGNLQDGVPTTSIIEESISLYEQEVGLG